MSSVPLLDPAIAWSLADGQFGDAFDVLGPHRDAKGRYVRVYLPGAKTVRVAGASSAALKQQQIDGLFVGRLGEGAYRLKIDWGDVVQTVEDCYAFSPLLSDLDLYLINEGRQFNLAQVLGGHPCTWGDVAGVRFAVWAPNARRVSVVGDFNAWDGRRHMMRRREGSGVWEFFVPGAKAGDRYKYEIVDRHGAKLPWKADPVAAAAELPPRTASIVTPAIHYAWRDGAWMKSRAERQTPSAPMSIYEVHVGSWLRSEKDATIQWAELADRLVPYARALNFTHIELLPVAEHPFTGSWGYQPLGLFAPTSRYGTPQEFCAFVDACHAADLGVIVDWVPAHFPNDEHGLARFDGTALYEHEDPREGFHQDWNTLIYNLGRREVSGFLLASAIHWLEHFHIDGLRVDAVASMLYRDYSRKPGEWIPNRYGGRENLEAVAFLQSLNVAVAERCPGAITIAEESTAWPGVTQPVDQGGLGFTFKWNMGWMHDTLQYVERNPIYRQFHHGEMTFGLVYAFSERFVLPLSHDEVVHGKRSLVDKMPGNAWEKFAGLRAYYGFMWGHPGKKLLFMGGEIAQWREWNADTQLDWDLLDHAQQRGIQHLVRDLNALYVGQPALHRRDADGDGFHWIVGEDSGNSVFAFARRTPDAAPVIVVVNMTPMVRPNYRLGVPLAGNWREILNSDAELYGGSNVGNNGGTWSNSHAAHGEMQSIEISLPPLAALYFTFVSPAE